MVVARIMNVMAHAFVIMATCDNVVTYFSLPLWSVTTNVVAVFVYHCCFDGTSSECDCYASTSL